MTALELKDIKTDGECYSEYVVLKIKFKVKGCRNIYILNHLAETKIKDMFGFDFRFLECCGWADPLCRTIEKRILFRVRRVYE